MELKLISQIKVPEYRQRDKVDPEAVAALRNSIVSTGLLHAIVLRDDDSLVAGENRLLAITEAHFLGEAVRHGTQTVPDGYIPVVHLGELTEVQALEAEYEENVRRQDLTWQQEAAATEKLHRLRMLQAAPTTPAEAKEVVMKLAEEVRGSRNGSREIHEQLLVVRNLEANPEAAKAKTIKEAVKIIKRAEMLEKYKAVGEDVATMSPASRHTLIHGDSTSVLCERTHAGKYAVILSDPPYGMGADNFGDSGGEGRSTGEHGYSDSYESWLELMGKLIPLTWTVTQPQAHLYMFCDFDRFHELKSALTAVGWKVFRTPLVLYKAGNSGRVPWPKTGPRRQYELVLFAVKGDKMLNNVFHDVIESPLIPDRMGHPAEKSVIALKNILQRSANAGDHVLDMCCGSGPIFEAGHELGLMVTGVEADATFYGMSKTRKEGLK